MSANDRRPDSVGGEPGTPWSRPARPASTSRRDPNSKRPAGREADRSAEIPQPPTDDDTGRVAIATAELAAPTRSEPDATNALPVEPAIGPTVKRRPQRPPNSGTGRRPSNSTTGSSAGTTSTMIDPGLVTESIVSARQPPPPDPRDLLDAHRDTRPDPNPGANHDEHAGEVHQDDVRDPQPEPPSRRQPAFAKLLQRLKEPFEPTETSAVPTPLVDDQPSTPSPDESAVPESTRRSSARARPNTMVRSTARSLPGTRPGQLPGQPPAPGGSAAFIPASLLTPAVPAPTRLVPVAPSVLATQSGPLPNYVDFDPEPEPQHQQIPTAPPFKRAVRSTAAVGRRRPRVRRVTRVVRHVDPWSVFKVALCFSVVLYGVCLTAGVLLWNVAYTTGTIDNMERFFESFGWDTFEFKGGELYHNAWISGLFVAIGLTGLIVLGVTLFNLITDLVGGVRVTVLEEEVVERDPLIRRAVFSGRRAESRPADPYDPDAPLDDETDHDLDREPTNMPTSADGVGATRIESTRDLHRTQILPNPG